MSLLRFLLHITPGRLIWAVLAGLVSGLGTTGLIAIINTALHGGSASSLTTLAIIFAAVSLTVIATGITASLLMLQVGQETVFRLRSRLSRQILDAPLRHLEQLGTARLMAALTSDIPVIANALGGLRDLCINFVIVAGCLGYLGWLSWTVLAGASVFILIGVASYQLLAMRGSRWLRRARESRDALYKHLRGLTEGLKELKLHWERRQSFLTELLDASAQEMKRHTIAGIARHAVANAWGRLLVFALIGLIVFILPSVQPTTSEVLTGYVLVILYMTGPLAMVLELIPALNQANVSLQKVESLGLSLQKKTLQGRRPARPNPKLRWERLELVGVTHSYQLENQEESFTLGPIDLSLQPGELVFLIGGNGSGKTTLAKLLSGLYSPEEGEIRLDGKAITDESREEYRQIFSMVFSDFYLFDQLLGLESPDLEGRVRDYLARLHLDQKVEVQGTKLSTTQLSQGQRKRLALLTAFAEDRPLYVFDEWAADQDPLFKRVFYHELLADLMSRGKTVIVISHDDQYYGLAHRIIKLDYGQLAPAPVPVALDPAAPPVADLKNA